MFFPFLSLSLKFACLTVILFFQDPVGGLFSRKTNNFFLLKNFSEWKREKREWCIFHSSAFHRASLLSSFFPPPFPFFLSFSSLFSFFPLSLSFRHIISIDPPSALKHIKAFFTSQYVRTYVLSLERMEDAWGGSIKLDLLVGRCEPPSVYILGMRVQNKCSLSVHLLLLRIFQYSRSRPLDRSIELLLWHYYVVVANAIFPSRRNR